MPFNLKVGGAWVPGTGAKVKVGGAWNTVENIQVKIGGAWQTAFTNSISPGITATVTPNPSTFSQDVTISGFVLPVPTGGTVLVRDSGDSPVGTQANVDTSTGAYSIIIPDQGIGTYTFSVNYSGFSLYQPASTNATVNVGTIPTTTSLTTSTASYVYNGTRATLSGTVSPTPLTGGSVTISNLSQGTIGVADVSVVNGSYSLLVPVKDVGSYTNISALFGGSGNYASSTSGTVSYSVTQASTTLTANTSSSSVQAGSSVALTATLTTASVNLSGRTITFQGLNSSSVWVSLGTGVTNASGAATFAWTAVSGYTQIRAIYGGETNYSGQTSAGVAISIFTNIATTTSIARSASTYAYNGTRVTISGTVSPVPTGGTVRITGSIDGAAASDFATSVAVNTTSGAYSAVMPVQNVGSYTSVTATYSGSGVYLSSASGTTSYDITKASTSITAPAGFTNNFGTAVTSSTKLTTGGVGFSGQTVVFQSSIDAGANWSTIASKTTDANGDASVDWTPGNSNTDRVRAVHNGSTNFSSSTSSAGTIYLRTLKTAEYTPANVSFSSPDDWQMRALNTNPDQIASAFVMPTPPGTYTDLQIYSMECKAAGATIAGASAEPGSLRLCIWSDGGTLLSAGPTERPAARTNGDFGTTNQAVVSSDIPNIAVTAGTTYLAGFWRQDNSASYTTQWAMDTATGTTMYYDTTAGAAPENFNKNSTFNNKSILFRVQYSYYS